LVGRASQILTSAEVLRRSPHRDLAHVEISFGRPRAIFGGLKSDSGGLELDDPVEVTLTARGSAHVSRHVH
jgi:hypothetical protein